MAKRLQVILRDSDYREIQRAARSRHMSLAEWVRRALEIARREERLAGVQKKLEAIESAVRNEYPTGDVEKMLAESEVGYRDTTAP